MKRPQPWGQPARDHRRDATRWAELGRLGGRQRWCRVRTRVEPADRPGAYRQYTFRYAQRLTDRAPVGWVAPAGCHVALVRGVPGVPLRRTARRRRGRAVGPQGRLIRQCRRREPDRALQDPGHSTPQPLAGLDYVELATLEW